MLFGSIMRLTKIVWIKMTKIKKLKTVTKDKTQSQNKESGLPGKILNRLLTFL